MAREDEHFTRDLTFRYAAVLGVLGLLAAAAFVALVFGLGRADTRLDRILQSIGPRIQVERVAFLANRLALLPAGERPVVASALEDSLGRLVQARAALAETEAGPPAPPRSGDDGVERELDRFIALARAVRDRADTVAVDDAALAALSAAAVGPLPDSLESSIVALRAAARDGGAEILALQGCALLVALLVLAAAAFGVFHPMVERLRADFADRLAAEWAVRDSEERLRRILDESPIGVSVSRRSDGRIVFANTRFSEILAMPREQFVGSFARDHYRDDDQRRAIREDLRRLGRIDGAEVEFLRKDGHPFWSLLTIRSTDFEGEAVNLAWIYDITARKAAEQQILLAAKVLETLSEGVMITDASNLISFVNPAFTAITEFHRDEVVGRSPSVLSSGHHGAAFYGDMWRRLRDRGYWSGEMWNRRKSGETYPVWLSIAAIREGNGQITHHVAVFSDITLRKADETRVWRQANYDALTGLPNRALFHDRLDQAVQQGGRDGKPFALLFIDLDGFKAVNDHLGHAAGDLLLQQVAGRLAGGLRSSDTLARLGGDEFVMILRGVRDRDDAAMLAEKLIEVLSYPFDLAGSPARVGGSVGIALFPDDADDAASLTARADQAMYAVKRRGKNGICFADDLVLSQDALFSADPVS